MEVSYTYWQHAVSGERYAIEMTDDEITGVCGPLHYDEITPENLPNFNYTSEDVCYVQSVAQQGLWNSAYVVGGQS